MWSTFFVRRAVVITCFLFLSLAGCVGSEKETVATATRLLAEATLIPSGTTTAVAGMSAASPQPATPALARVEPPPTATLTAESRPPRPTATTVLQDLWDVELAAEAGTLPTPAATAVVELSPTLVLTPTAMALAQLPIVEEIDFTIAGHFGGVPHALAVDGAIAYVGFGPRLLAVDVSDEARPQLLGRSPLLPDVVQAVDVAGGVAYLAAGRGGLILLDVRDPAAIQIVSLGPNYAGATQPSAEDVIVVGNTAYVVDTNRQDGSKFLLRFDVSNPAQVTLLGEHELEISDSATVAGDLIAVVGSGRLELRRAADPDAVLSQMPLASGTYTSRAVIHESIVTVAETAGLQGGVEQFDVSDPSQPVSLGELVEVEFLMGVVGLVATDGRTLFVAGTFGDVGYCGSEIQVVNVVARPPRPVATFLPQSCARAMDIQGNILYVAGSGGLRLFDVSDPAVPALRGHFAYPDGFGNAQAVAPYGAVSYVLANEGGGTEVVALDLNQPTPVPIADRLSLDTHDLFVSDHMLLAPGRPGGVHILDISDPAAPQILLQPEESEPAPFYLFTLALNDDVLYVRVTGQGLTGGIGAIDLSNPANPTLAATTETQYYVNDMVLDNETLYVLSQDDTYQIHIFDVSQPLQPQRSGILTLPGAATRLAVVGNTLYAACYIGNCPHLYGIDVSDRQSPVITHQWQMPLELLEMVTDGEGVIYLVTHEGIWALAAADPDDLHLAGYLPLAGEFSRIKVVADKIYAAAFDAGLYVVEINR